MPKRSSTEDVVYNFVCKNPGKCTYFISKNLNMSGGRVRHALNVLNKKGLIRFKFERKNPRIKKLTYPVSAWRLLPRKIRGQLKKIEVKIRHK